MRSKVLVVLLALTTSVAAAPKRRASSPDRCTEIVTPSTLSFPAAGGQSAVNVTIKGGCPLSPVADGSWLTVGVTGGIVTVTAGANTSTTARTSLVHLRSTVVVVTQDATTNLLTNGSFDTNLVGWSSERSKNGTPQWVNGTAVLTSGSGSSVAQLDQCVNIDPSTRYEAGANVLIPSGQPNGAISFGIFEYLIPNCDPAGAFHAKIVNQLGSPTGTPFDTTINWTSDLNAKSVLIAIGAGSAAGPFSATFDDVYVRKKQ